MKIEFLQLLKGDNSLVYLGVHLRFHEIIKLFYQTMFGLTLTGDLESIFNKDALSDADRSAADDDASQCDRAFKF